MTVRSSRYPIAAVRERVRRHDGPVLDFVLGQHREPMPPDILDLLDNANLNELVAPCECAQIEAFTEAAAAMLRHVYGVDVATGAILPVPGGRTAISLLASTLIRPQDGVVVFDPAYPALTRVVRQLGARVHTVTLDPDRNLAPDLDVLTAAGAASVRFAALNYPNNPTGTIIDQDHLVRFFERLDTAAVVFNDATYGPLTFDGPPWSLLARSGAASNGRRLLELHSLAKMFSVGPIAVSFLAGDPELIRELRDYSEFALSDQSRLHLEIAVRCLRNLDHLATVRETFRGRIQRLQSELTTLGFDPLPSRSGMYIVCRVPSSIGGRPVSGAGEAADVLLRDHHLAVVPWEVEPHEYLRFSGQYSEDDLHGLTALGRNGKLVR